MNASEPNRKERPPCVLCGALFVLVLAFAVSTTTGAVEIVQGRDVADMATVAVALAALFVAVHEARQSRAHARQSLRPHLVFESAFWGDRDFVGLRVTNNGLGPAMIREAELFVDGKSCGSLSPDGWIVVTINLSFFESWLKATGLSADESIGPGTSLPVISVPGAERTAERTDHLIQILERLAVRMNYESFYGDEYQAKWSGQDLKSQVLTTDTSA